MRKTLSLVLSIVMVLSLAIIGISAADATEIKTEAEFLAMAADGNYKLGADITLTATYGVSDTIVPFTGTLDGNGHTLTVSAPVFAELNTNACIKNLIIGKAGDKIEYTAETHCGALARSTPKDAKNLVFENIVNNCDITAVTAGSWRRGGLIGQMFDGAEATFVNCTNNGDVLGGNMIGGLVGYAQGSNISFKNCVNNGDVTIDISTKLTGLAGGIIGRFGGDNAYAADTARKIVITNCLNTGNITGTTQTAGIIAHTRGCDITVSYCTNKGNIKSTTYLKDDGVTYTGSADAAGIYGATGSEKGYYSPVRIDRCLNEGKVVSVNSRAAGIAGYVWCGNYSDIYFYAEITNCINKGAIEGGSFVSQMLTYTNDGRNMEGQKQNTKIKGVGLGTVARCADTTRAADKTYLCFIGVSSSKYAANYDVDVTLADCDLTNIYAWAEAEANIANRVEWANKPETVKVVSTADAQAAAAALGTVGYVEPKTPDTGDSMIWVAVIALVSIMGMGIAVKARNN